MVQPEAPPDRGNTVKKFYLTTTLPYVNAPPHIGFALELVQADVIARYHAGCGEEVFFNTGTDEHGLKIYRQALAEGKNPQVYADEYAEKFRKLKTALNLWDGVTFIRTTDPHHVAAAQEFWKRCSARGFIYKGGYKIKYCVGCELEKADSELVDGRCPLHPGLALEEIEEENYFFRFSKFQKSLLELYKKYSDFVLPDFRFNEIRKFVERGLQDFSISRLAEKMPWGVPVPGDSAHVMYVWFDALINYISTLGWPEDEKKFQGFWGTGENPNAVQVAGKDNLRQQSAMWQAMLLAAGLPTSRQILIHGFITSAGEKMSKSLGNVTDPYEIIGRVNRETHSTCGTDALRFWLVHDMPTFNDGDFTWEKFKESYNANLANGLGNLVSRVMKMAETAHILLKPETVDRFKIRRIGHLDNFEIQKAAEGVWNQISAADKFIQEEEPFKRIKTEPAEAKRDILQLLTQALDIGKKLAPFLPATSEKMIAALKSGELDAPLFPRMP